LKIGLTGIYWQTVKTGLQKIFFFMKDLRIYGRKDVPRKRIFVEIIQEIVKRLRIWDL
jgi:hypothetical protein